LEGISCAPLDGVGKLWIETGWLGIMAAPCRVIDISITEDDLAQLERIARSRTEPAGWVKRARILLAYRADPSAHAVGEAFGVTHQTVLRCLRRAETQSTSAIFVSNAGSRRSR
jgi:hypothetical protein